MGEGSIASNDIDRDRLKAALRESEERFHIMADIAFEITVVHINGVIVDVNNAVMEISGYGRDEVLGQNVFDFYTPESQKMLKEKLRSPDPGPYEAELVRKDGQKIIVQVRGRDIIWKGKPARLASAQDITKLKRAENGLRRANEKLNLLSSITRHDLNNQLTALSFNLELLRSQTSDINSLKRIGQIEQIMARIRSQVEFTKDYHKMGSTAPRWQKIWEVIEALSVSKEIEHLEVSEKVRRLKIYADPMLGKVFHNLIEDSIRYGGKPSMIKLDCLQSNDCLVLIYEDVGEGIPTDEKEKIFQKGYGKGTGLGLFLSREILDITGISISENGVPGKGARFELRIPSGQSQFEPTDNTSPSSSQ